MGRGGRGTLRVLTQPQKSNYRVVIGYWLEARISLILGQYVGLSFQYAWLVVKVLRIVSRNCFRFRLSGVGWEAWDDLHSLWYPYSNP